MPLDQSKGEESWREEEEREGGEREKERGREGEGEGEREMYTYYTSNEYRIIIINKHMHTLLPL